MPNDQASALNLSDEDFLKQAPALLETANAAAEADPENKDEVVDDTTTTADTTSEDNEAAQAQAAAAAEVVEEDDKNKTTTEETTTEADEEVDGEGKPVVKDPKTAVVDPKAKPDKKPAKVAAPVNNSETINYQAEYERLLAPFKANGRDIKVENVDEAVRLMQMGANYNKKMAALKPTLAMMKTLENNKLLTPEKINFLIDVANNNPEAISKLIKESGIDPLDITTEKAGDYTPVNHAVDETQVELDNVLDEIKDSDKYVETLDVVTKQWDPKSKALIANQPQLLKVINGHMESGIYDLVAAELERKKLFGGLNGLSDLEAYRQIGDAMATDGKFDAILKQPGQAAKSATQTTAVKTVVKPAPKKADDSKRDEQRRAAAPAKGAAPSGKLPADFNPLAMSDEDFAKFKPTF